MSRAREPILIHADDDSIRAASGVTEFYSPPGLFISSAYAVPLAGPSTSAEENAESAGSSKEGWIVGDELEKARREVDFESKYELRYPFRSYAPEDWAGREFVLAHVLSALGSNGVGKGASVVLVPPATNTNPLSTQASYAQLAFEKLNLPAFGILPVPLAALFALGATTGVVVHIGSTTTTVSVVIDSIVRTECSAVAQVGKKDCERHLIGLLLSDAGLERDLRAAAGKGDEAWKAGEKERLVTELGDVIWRECTGDDIEVVAASGAKTAVSAGGQVEEEGSFDVAKKLIGEPGAPSNPSHKSKKQLAAQQAKASAAAAAAAEAAAQAVEADVITLTIPSLPEKEINVGAIRHRLCEPLFNGAVPGGETVWEAVGRAIGHATLPLSEQLALWDAVGVIGDVARIKSFAPALITYLAPFLLSSSEIPSEVQPSKARLLAIPDYFTNYKGSTPDLAPFLGLQMAHKMILSDSTLSVTKIQYNNMGPPAMYTMKGEGV